MSFASLFGAFAASLARADVPTAVDAEARRCVLDTIGVAIAGASHPTAAAARGYGASFLGGGSATVLGGGFASPAAAALLNGTAAHAWDFDDTCYAGIVHPSAVVLPAVLAVAPLRGRSDREARAAFLAGVETVCALGHAMTNATYFDGWWTTGLFGAVGAAAGAASALGLDAEACATAIAHAAVLAAGCRAVLGTAAKPLGCGHAARLGVEAAGLAALGIDAPLDVIEHPLGFALPRGRAPLPVEPPSPSDPASWRILCPGIARKRFPACSAMQAAGEGLMGLMREHRFGAREIAAIDCGATRLVVESLIHHRPRSAAEAQFSLEAALATIAAFGDFGVKELASEAWMAPEAATLMQRVTLRCTPEAFDAEAEPEGAIIEVMLHDGRRFERAVAVAAGMPSRPLTDEALAAKFAACTVPALGRHRSEALAARLMVGDGDAADLLRAASDRRENDTDVPAT